MNSKRFLLKVSLALIVGCALLIGVGLASYASISGLIKSANRAATAEKTLVLLDNTFFTMDRVEETLQKYMQTGDASDLEEWQRVSLRFRDNRLSLQALTQLPELVSVNAMFTERQALVEKAVEVRKTVGMTAALDILNSGEFQSLRQIPISLLGAVQGRERDAVIEADVASRESALQVQKLIIVIGILLITMVGWVVYVINHYEKKRDQINDQLRESEALSRSITEGMVEGVITMDGKNIIIEVNQSVLRLFACEKEDMLGRHFSKLLPKRIKSEFDTLITSIDGSSASLLVDHEVPCQRKDGSEFLVRMSLSQVLVNSVPVRTVLIHDITERKTAADALRASEFLLRQVTDTVPALIAYLDKDENFRFHNKAYEEISGLSFDQINGHLLSDVLGQKAYAAVQEKVAEVLLGYVVRYERIQLSPRGDFRTYFMEYFPRYGDDARDGEVVGFFAMGTDITELKRIDQMKTEFISTVSHELRTPLTSIRGSLGLISGGVAGDLPEGIKNLVEIAKNNCERLIRLINDILDSEKIESGNVQMDLQVRDVRKLIEQALLQNQGFAIQHQVKLLFHAAEGPFYGSIDSDRLTQVLTNLLSNAVKFSPAGDVVEVKLSCQNHVLRIEVLDHGSGIPEQFHARIFQKFSQADSSDSRQKGGTGLGLNISRSIIEKMKGKIGFFTVLNAGTTFFIELPEWHAPEPALQAIRIKSTASKPRILICEDDPDVATLIGMMLAKAGFETDTTYSAEEAIVHLGVHHYDAMTVDLNLPGENGMSLINKLRGEPKTSCLPIVVVSARARDGALELNHPPLSISDWLKKPIDERILTFSVRRAVASLSSTKPRVLYVEDDPDIQHVVAAIGKDVAIFQFATSLEEARKSLRDDKFDLVLLDLSLGTESGWDLIQDIDTLDPRPQVIVFSASDRASDSPGQANVVLIKSQTSNAELLNTIRRVLSVPEEVGLQQPQPVI